MTINYRELVASTLEVVEPAIEQTKDFKWIGDGTHQAFGYVKRAAIQRQHEFLRAILELSKLEIGYVGVTAIRPAYEERVWIEYLGNLELRTANKILLLLTHAEATASLQAQNDYWGQSVMKNLGFSQRYVKATLAKQSDVRKDLKEIGKKLGWPERALVPPVAFLAKKLEETVEYNFLYHGTSRFVHFSVVELYRRVWGEHGNMKIGSKAFSKLWEDFALYWGLVTFIKLLLACREVIDESKYPQEKGAAIMRGVPPAQVPIITAAELKPW